jgi:hypothetical protein
LHVCEIAGVEVGEQTRGADDMNARMEKSQNPRTKLQRNQSPMTKKREFLISRFWFLKGKNEGAARLRLVEEKISEPPYVGCYVQGKPSQRDVSTMRN